MTYTGNKSSPSEIAILFPIFRQSAAHSREMPGDLPHSGKYFFRHKIGDMNVHGTGPDTPQSPPPCPWKKLRLTICPVPARTRVDAWPQGEYDCIEYLVLPIIPVHHLSEATIKLPAVFPYRDACFRPAPHFSGTMTAPGVLRKVDNFGGVPSLSNSDGETHWRERPPCFVLLLQGERKTTWTKVSIHTHEHRLLSR